MDEWYDGLVILFGANFVGLGKILCLSFEVKKFAWVNNPLTDAKLLDCAGEFEYLKYFKVCPNLDNNDDFFDVCFVLSA